MSSYKDAEILSMDNICFTEELIENKNIKEIKHEFERISLAYRGLNHFPKKLSTYLGKNIKILDLTFNNLECLSFLSNFPFLNTLILDRNVKLKYFTLPYMPMLQILWLNNCNIVNTSDWLYSLKENCPNLNHLSMMCNPVGLTCLNGISIDQEIQYRDEISQILPSLTYLDGLPINNNITKQNKNLLAKLSLIKSFESICNIKLDI